MGWQWLLQLARHHDVVLLTHAYFQSQLEPALAQADVVVEVEYFQAPAFGVHPHRQLNSRLYYVWWQWQVRSRVRQLLQARHFDLIHHLTWGTLRFPCLLGGLGVPLVMGPLGGGESAPLRFFNGLPLATRAFDYLRSLTLQLIRVDPLATWGPRRSALVLCKSSETLKALPLSVQPRAVVATEIGSPPPDIGSPVHPRTLADTAGRRWKLLFAGRLLGWKGVALALGATERLVRAGKNVQLDIAGDGPLRGYLLREIERRALHDHVRLLGSVPRPQMLAMYREADLFVFPSLHDSSGNVVLESLSRGLPVICLDLGGPKHYVDPDSGVVVATAGRSADEVEQALADAVSVLIADPQRLQRMSAGARQHAVRQSWESAVQVAYAHVARHLGWQAAP